MNNIISTDTIKYPIIGINCFFLFYFFRTKEELMTSSNYYLNNFFFQNNGIYLDAEGNVYKAVGGQYISKKINLVGISFNLPRFLDMDCNAKYEFCLTKDKIELVELKQLIYQAIVEFEKSAGEDIYMGKVRSIITRCKTIEEIFTRLARVD